MTVPRARAPPSPRRAASSDAASRPIHTTREDDLTTTSDRQRSPLDEAMERLLREVRDGLRHGFFELTVTGEIVKGGRRGLTIKAGKSHRFTIAPEDLD